MLLYMTETKFSEASLAALANKPSDRPAEVAKVIEAYGGKMKDFYWVFGDMDAITIYEAPNHQAAMAILLTLSAGGAIASHRTTALISNKDAMKAMKKAGTKKTGYKPPNAEWKGWLDEGGEG